MPQLKKPLFKPPVSNSTNNGSVSSGSSSTPSSTSSKSSKPTPGQKGWLVAVAAANTQDSNMDDADTCSPSPNSQGSGDGASSGKQPGWLLARVENQEIVSELEDGSSQSDAKQSKPELGEKGWLVSVATANDDDNSQSQPLSNSSQCFSDSQDSSKLVIDESQSQDMDLESNKRGEKGWLVSKVSEVSIAQSSDNSKPSKSKAKRFSMPTSKKSGISSQEKEKKNKRASLSSFDFFGSQEADRLISNLDSNSINNNNEASQGSSPVEFGQSDDKDVVDSLNDQQAEILPPEVSETIPNVDASLDTGSKPNNGNIPPEESLIVLETESVQNPCESKEANVDVTSNENKSEPQTEAEFKPKKGSETNAKKKNKITKVKEASETATKSKPKSKKVKPSTSKTPSEESGAKSSEASAQAEDKSKKKASKKPKKDSAMKSTIKPSFGKTPKPVTKTPQEEKETPAPTIILPQTQNNNKESVGETEVGMTESVDVTDSQELVASSITDLISRVVTEVVSCSGLSGSDKTPNVVAKKRKIAKKPKNVSSTKSKSSQAEPPVKKAKIVVKPKKKSDPLRKNSNDCDTRNALLKLQKMRTSGTWVMCTRVTCGKWRYLDVKDPAEVNELFTCSDNPDPKFNSCQSTEQLWSKNLNNNIVETRFTVGSLVWARMEGWPSWPGMVDDDPDTGSFFWTEMRGERWEDKPNSYHIVFFDDKDVTRAWIPNVRLRKFDKIKPSDAKSKLGARLGKAFEEAMKAADMSLMGRRKEFCLASRFKGPWGPVWPGCGEEESGWYDGPDHFNVQQISQDIMNQDEQERNMSFIDKSFSCDVLKSVDEMDTGHVEDSSFPIAKKSHPFQDVTESFLEVDSGTVNVEHSESNTSGPVARKSNPPTVEISEAKSKSKPRSKSDKKSADKENVAPVSENIVAHLYKDKSIFTQNLSETIHPSTSNYAPSVSFTEGEDLDLFNSSLAREVDQALQVANLYTPIKRSQLGTGSMKSSPAPSSSLTTSTPVRQVVLNSSIAGRDNEWEINKDVDNIFGAGDTSNNLDTSAAFSHHDSD